MDSDLVHVEEGQVNKPLAIHYIVELLKTYFFFFFKYYFLNFKIGFVEVSIMHPLDLIKTRFQIQRGPDDPNRYTSLVDCFKKMYRNEG